MLARYWPARAAKFWNLKNYKKRTENGYDVFFFRTSNHNNKGEITILWVSCTIIFWRLWSRNSFHFLCKILRSSKFIAKSKRPEKQPTRFRCIGSAKNESKTKQPRLAELSSLTAKSSQSDHDEFSLYLLTTQKPTKSKALCAVAKQPCSRHKRHCIFSIRGHFLISSYHWPI